MKVALVTGANSGIGKFTAIELAQLDYHVILACRNPKKARQAIDDIELAVPKASLEFIQVDLGEQDSMDAFADKFYQKYSSLDVLVNNAGIWTSKRKENSKGYELMFAVNHLGYVYLTYKLMPALLSATSARIVNVSSNAHRWATKDLDDLQWKKKRWSTEGAYGASKMANIWFTKELAKRLPKHLSVNALHPGVVATNLGEGLVGVFFKLFGFALKSPKQGAQTSVFLASSGRVLGKSGGFYANRKEKKLNKLAKNEEVAKELWSRSDELLGISFDDVFE